MSIARNITAVCFLLCSFFFQINAQPVYSLEECKLRVQIDSAYNYNKDSLAVQLIREAVYSQSPVKQDRRVYTKAFYAYKKLGQKDSALHYLFQALYMGTHALYSQPFATHYFQIFDEKTNHTIDSFFAENNKVNVINHDLLLQLKKMNLYDQVARGNVFYKDSVSAHTWDSLRNCMHEVDSLNRMEAKRIVYMYGWPGYKALGEKGDANLWILVQHADADVAFQEFALQQMAAEVLANNTSKRYYAYLYDRVCVNKGLPQVFATQAKPYKKDKEWIVNLDPLQDSANINYYRIAFDLSSFEGYEEGFKQYLEEKEKNGAFIPYSNK